MDKVFIIAEAGVNHNGDINNAKKLIEIAAKAGADAIKFQSFKADNMVTKKAVKAEYQSENGVLEKSQYLMLKKLELSEEYLKELKEYAISHNILFLSSPFDLQSIDILEALEIEIYKIPSGEIENVPYLRKIGALGKRVILSTGMSTLEDIDFAIAILSKAGTKDITLLHCTSNYPTEFSDVNLRAMITLKEKYNLDVGYSDHTEGIEVSIAAVALGARVIEKHFTISKNMEGPDHKASLEPKELGEMVRQIRNIEEALGSYTKNPNTKEMGVLRVARKSIVAIKEIRKGEIFTEDNIGVKRPAQGVSPKEWDNYIGEKSSRDYKVEEFIDNILLD